MQFMRVYLKSDQKGLTRGAEKKEHHYYTPSPTQSIWWNPNCNYLIMATQSANNVGNTVLEKSACTVDRIDDGTFKILFFNEMVEPEFKNSDELLGVNLNSLNEVKSESKPRKKVVKQ